ncbi:MAG TPA: alanine dehydrogenase [Candidatus Hydrogenedentes bacterium]|nr:alanine dehydrogenase [Candidatus Hydrogenedentota bacterium]HQM50336.1 alanine dehydrogenase [Candidatus Hydrogenedentota bacterium]
MLIGVPKEIKADERRVAIVPSGVAAFRKHSHRVMVEKGAGLGSGISDEAYAAAGAEIVAEPKDIWARAEMIVKVKEPIGDELEWMWSGQIIYTYLHLASNEALTHKMLEKEVIGVAYETVQLPDASLPLLAPMSEVAGRLAAQIGAHCLEASSRGMGILLGGVSGVKPANVTILGAGVAGTNACHLCVSMGAHVTVLDINPSRLRYLYDIMASRVTTVMSNTANLADEVACADLVIGAVLIPGARTPRLITDDLVSQMRPGSAFVDIAIDQGGCSDTSRPTTHHDPTYVVHDVVHYCVSNMPGAVPRTSTYALTNVTLGYGLAIAKQGIDAAIEADPAVKKGVNTYKGKLTCKAVADAFGMQHSEI